jgi:hypothetical protein
MKRRALFESFHRNRFSFLFFIHARSYRRNFVGDFCVYPRHARGGGG